MPNKKTVLITGVSSGVGRAIAQLLAGKELQVFGTSRNPTNVSLANVTVLPLDVTSDESVQTCVKTIIQQVGRLDILINNAGLLVAGAVEEVTMAQLYQQFETNFFGALRTIQAVLPYMRQQQSGQIINISSLAGLTPPPFWGAYNASKFAIEGLTETLRDEVKPFNIHVSLVEPGHLNSHESGFEQNAQIGANLIGDYAAMRERTFARIHKDEAEGPNSMKVAQVVWSIIQQKKPRLRHPFGNQVVYYRIKRWIPEGIYEKGHRNYYNLDGKK